LRNIKTYAEISSKTYRVTTTIPAGGTRGDFHLLAEGRHWKSYEKLGAHLHTIDGVPGANFAVWAPNAGSVSVAGALATSRVTSTVGAASSGRCPRGTLKRGRLLRMRRSARWRRRPASEAVSSLRSV
jgi:hypothetical protein